MEKINIENKQSSNLIKEQFTKGAGSNKLIEIIAGIKVFLMKRETILFLLFFLISSLSFGMGYLYAKEQNISPIIIQKNC